MVSYVSHHDEPTPTAAPRSRDPEGRRLAILTAAVDVMAEVGIERASHRAIADRAGVPLGSTTHYFASRDALMGEALERAYEVAELNQENWRCELLATADVAEAVVRMARECVADLDWSRIEFELYIAAARRPELRHLAQLWLSSFRLLVGERTRPDQAKAIGWLFDGATLEATALQAPIDSEGLRAAVMCVLDG